MGSDTYLARPRGGRIGGRYVKEQGIGAAAVIVIVGVIAVVVIGALLLLRGSGDILPAYPGAQKLAEESFMGYTAKLYSFTGSCEDVYNWYKSQMPAEGWTLGYDGGYIEGEGCLLNYTKGGEVATIIISESEAAISTQEETFSVDVPSGSKTIFLAQGPAP